MNKKMSSLGRGLDALINPNNLKIDTESNSVSYQELQQDDGNLYDILVKVPVESISPNPFQPRVHFDEQALDELKKSILSNGLIQPITVRRKSDRRYELISGERRLRACTDIGYREIPVYIIKVETEEAMLAMALIENIQREKLNPIEVGMAYRRLMEECRLTQDQIAEKVGKDRTTVANTIRLLKLPKEVQDALVKEEISSGHARAMINLPSEKLQLEALMKIREGNLSVRKVEALVKKLLTDKDNHKKPVSINSISNLHSSSVSAVEDRLRTTFGTKVICRQKNDGSGEIVIEFYSHDELERLFELFDIINKTYS